MRLKIKDMDIATGGPLVSILNIEDAKHLDLHMGDRIRLTYKNRTIVTLVDIAESEHAVPIGFIGLFEEVLNALGAKDYHKVKVELESKPESVSYIKQKLDGEELTKQMIDTIVYDIVHNNLTDIELAYFVGACHTRGLSKKETVYLTKAMIAQGHQLKLKKPVFDKHCIGGVPNNRTTMIVVPIIAAAGLTIPKTSSRSITSPAGTADTMEVLANVTIPVEKIKEILSKANGCMVWGGGMNLAAADDKLINIRHSLSLDPLGMLLASVMAKKGSVSATHVLIDIPYGKGAKITSLKKAKILKQKFEELGKSLGMVVKVVITDGSHPIGNGIGPVLEAIDVMKVLSNAPDAPHDLMEKSIRMAGIMLEMAGKARNGQGKKLAMQILKSGKALAKMEQIIELQGKMLDWKTLKPAKHKVDIIARKSGKVTFIDNKRISKAARVAGAPEDIYSGIFLHKKHGDTVKRGDKLFTIYSQSKTKLKFALDIYEQIDGYEIS